MKDFFNELFQYGHHFNQQLVDSFTAHPDIVSEKSVKLFSHMLNAHQIWNNRVDPRQTTFEVWQMHPIAGFKQLNLINYEHSIDILNSDLDLDQVFSYSTSRGDLFSNSLGDILFHIINHTTYHRAQIAAEFRQCGLEPLLTDYIMYKRTL